jgi:ABC-type antimicrobial peptide transport system permease subunit
MVVRQGMVITGAGLVVGVVAAVVLSRFVAPLLYSVDALDPITFVGIPLLLGVVALAATYLPARRASRIDPMIAFKAD